MAMTIPDTTFNLEIQKMPEGGYLVADGGCHSRDGNFRMIRFASTSIDEALKYIRSKLEPKK